MRILWIFCLPLFLALTPAGALADERASVTAAITASGDWLAIIDAGDYEKSWKQSAELFQQRVSEQQWQEMLTKIRPPFGAIVSRTVAQHKYTTTLPGAPDGQYVIAVYHSSFKNKEKAAETLTVMRDEDGMWRVAGYFIK